MSGSILSRVSAFASNSDLSRLQSQVDARVGEFQDHATDLKSLAALSAGGVAYRLGRLGALSSSVLRPLSLGLGLAAEVSVFEGTSRSLQVSPLQNSSSLWKWSGSGGLRQGLLSSLITFSTLKGFGRLVEGQNIVLQHAAQDGAMVLGHQAAYRLGLGAKPEGSLAEQLLRAEATNWQLKSGLAVAQGFAPGLHALDRGLDLSLEGGFRIPEIFPAAGKGMLQPALASSSSLMAPLKSGERSGLESTAMASLGSGGLFRKNFPYVEEKTLQIGGTSLSIKLLSKKPIPDVRAAASRLGEVFLNILSSGNNESTLQGPIASQLTENPQLRALLSGPVKKLVLQFDLDGQEILTLRVFKDEFRMDFSVPRTSFTSPETESTRPALPQDPELSKKLSLPLAALSLKGSSEPTEAPSMREDGSLTKHPFNRPVSDLEPSLRIENIFARHGIEYIGQLVQKTPADLKKAPNVGRRSINRIQELLKVLGLSLGMHIDWQPPKRPLDLSIDELELSVRASHALQHLGIITVKELVQKSEADLSIGKSMGRETLREIKEVLAGLGLSLKYSWEGKMTKEQLENLDSLVQDLPLSSKTKGVLERDGYRYVGDLARKSKQEFLRSRGIGPRSFSEVEEALKKLGLSFGMDLLLWLRPQLFNRSPSSVLDESVEVLELSVRSATALEHLKIKTVGDLVHKSEADLYRGGRIGRRMLREIKKVLADRRLFLKGSPPETLPETPAVTMILGFDLPYSFDSAAFNVSGLRMLGEAWEKSMHEGVRLLQKMGEEFTANQGEADVKKQQIVSELLAWAHSNLVEAVLSDRIRKNASPQQVHERILRIDKELESWRRVWGRRNP